MSHPTQPHPLLPERPQRRPAPRRSHTLLFWTVLVLFAAAICYLGLLALGESADRISRSAIDLHRNAEIAVALCVILALAGAVVSRHPVR